MGFGFYGERYHIHVIDLDPSLVTSGGWLEDTSLVEKYKILDEDYQKCDGKFSHQRKKLVLCNRFKRFLNSFCLSNFKF